MSGNLTNLGFSAETNTLYVSNINYQQDTGKLTLELPTNYQSGSVSKIIFETNGNLDTLGALKLFSGTDLSSPFTSTNRYSVQLNGTNSFEIYDNVAGTWRMRIDSTTGSTTFNPPFGGTSLTTTNVDSVSSPVYPTFLGSSASGSTSVIDVVSTMTYIPSTQTLNVNILNASQIKLSGAFYDSTNNTGTSAQYLSSTGTATQWITLPSAPVVNDGTLTITNGTYMTGSGTFTANQAGNTSITIGTNATNNNTVSTIVARDSAGNFSAGTITADLSGNSTSASSIYVINSSAAGDFQVPVLTTTHAGAGNYTLKVDGTTSIFTYNTNTHTLKPINIILSGTFADATSSVGTSGQYLTSTATGTSWVTLPTIPVVNDGTLTISAGTYMTGSGTFTANQAGNTSITIGTNAVSTSTVDTLVARNPTNAGFSAGPITATSFSGPITTTVTTSNAGTYFIIFTGFNTNAANVMRSGANLTYIPSTSTLNPVNINLTGTLTAASGGVGTSGQVLSSTGTGTSWITPTTVNNGTLTITNGTYMTGSGTFTANQAGNTSITIGTNATSANTNSTIVARDSAGAFSAGNVSVDNLFCGTNVKISDLLTNFYWTLGANNIFTIDYAGTVLLTINDSATTGITGSQELRVGSSTTTTQLRLTNSSASQNSWNINNSSSQLIFGCDNGAGGFSSFMTLGGNLGSRGLLTLSGNSAGYKFEDRTSSGNFATLYLDSGTIRFNTPTIGDCFSVVSSTGTILAPSGATISGYITQPTTILDNTSSAGTSGKILSSTGTAISWVDAPALVSTTATNLPAVGNYYPTFVSSSTSGSQTLRTDTGITYDANNNTLTTTTFSGSSKYPVGTTITDENASTGNAYEVVGKGAGTAGITWLDVPVRIASGSFTAATSYTSGAVFSAAFKDYRLVIRVTTGTNASTFNLQLGNSGGIFSTAVYTYLRLIGSTNTTQSTQTSWSITNSTPNYYPYVCEANLYSPFEAVTHSIQTAFNPNTSAGGGTYSGQSIHGQCSTTTSADRFTITISSAVTGTWSIYGQPNI